MGKTKEKTKLLKCTAATCRNKVIYGSYEWTKQWMRVWVEDAEGLGASYDACSEKCATRIKKEKGRGKRRKN